jgi:hypothetical protein
MPEVWSMQIGGPPGTLWIFPPVLYEEASMTAIGAVGTSEGFVIAADGRKRLDAESRATATPDDLALESDEAQKIFPITGGGKLLAYGASGLIHLGAVDVLAEIRNKIDLLSYRKRFFWWSRRFLRTGEGYVDTETLVNSGVIVAYPRLREEQVGNRGGDFRLRAGGGEETGLLNPSRYMKGVWPGGWDTAESERRFTKAIRPPL